MCERKSGACQPPDANERYTVKRMSWLLLWALCSGGFVGSVEAAELPWRDAVAAWHFADAEGAPTDFSLTAQGDVKLGMPLADKEAVASRARGGDGRVAEFHGGYLQVNGPSWDPATSVFTLLLRVRDSAGAWNHPLFGSYGGDNQVSLYLRGVDGGTLPFEDRNFVNGAMATPAAWMFGWPAGPRAIHGSRGVVEFLWGAQGAPNLTPARLTMLPKEGPQQPLSPLSRDARNGVARVMFPVQPCGPTDWHDVVVRGTEAKLELWIDGVLVDEEFTIGATRAAATPRLFGAAQLADGQILTGFRGQLDHAGLWHRALTVSEIRALSGGENAAVERELAILGPPATQMQYYRARGHNSKAGDCIPFYHEGTFHLFYLILRRNMHSKWDGGHGGLEIHHASSQDLRTWKHHPVSIPVSEQWEAWQGTGGVVHHDGKFWMFYPTPDYDGNRGGIQLGTSADGDLFTKHPTHPFLPGGDCEVFADPDPQQKLFHLLKAGKSYGAGLPELRDKTLVCWVSPADLEQRGAGVLTVEGPGGQFDSLVLGEAAPRRWMAGSDNFQRTQRDQQANAEETARPGEWVQLAAVYAGNSVTLYRNGTLYAQYTVEKPLHFAAGARVLVGLRHLDRRNDPAAFFRGSIADARVYGVALTDTEIAQLRPHEASSTKPLVWFDFGRGLEDRAGTLPAEPVQGTAAVRDGALVLAGRPDCLLVGARKATLAHWVSEDLMTWRELDEPFIVTDESMVPAMCPHWFRWNDWYYFIGGVGGVWKSRQPYGPWTLQSPWPLDSLGVPKTGAFADNRRLFAGFVSDGGWGGNLVVRELLQHADGTLGTRFVPEMMPAAGDPLRLKQGLETIRLATTEGRRQQLIDAVPHDALISLTLVPHGKVAAFGVRLRTTDGTTDGTELRLVPDGETASYSHSTHSGSRGPLAGGPAISGVRGLTEPVRLVIVCIGDLVDVEINGQHTLANRFWNPPGTSLGVWVEAGEIEVRDVSVRPLARDE